LRREKFIEWLYYGHQKGQYLCHGFIFSRWVNGCGVKRFFIHLILDFRVILIILWLKMSLLRYLCYFWGVFKLKRVENGFLVSKLGPQFSGHQRWSKNYPVDNRSFATINDLSPGYKKMECVVHSFKKISKHVTQAQVCSSFLMVG
jgi:hypothetical protein